MYQIKLYKPHLGKAPIHLEHQALNRCMKYSRYKQQHYMNLNLVLCLTILSSTAVVSLHQREGLPVRLAQFPLSGDAATPLLPCPIPDPREGSGGP